MYNFPDQNISFLKNKKVVSIKPSEHQIQFELESGINISWEYDFDHYVADENKTYSFEVTNLSADTKLNSLVSKQIAEARVLSGNHLQLDFENGDILTLKGDSKDYECYQITWLEGSIIV